MKFTLITVTFITLFIGINASAYQNGFITGMLVEKALPSKKSEFDKYNTVIIDTALFDFPKQKTPMCRPIQVKKVKYYSKFSFGVFLLLMILIFSMTCNACNNDPEFADFMLGYLLGQMIERAFSNDD